MMTNFTKRLSLLMAAVVVFGFSATAQTVLFSEEFNGGLGTFVAGAGTPVGAIWEHSSDGTAGASGDGTISALFWGTGDPIGSATVANGCAMYNSDVYDGGGVAVGSGAYPGTHSGDLTSPTIDLSGESNISLKFNQSARANANDVSTLLDISTDGGTTWVNYPINPGITGNASTADDDVQLIDISSVAANQANVKVRFTWNGRYYYWLVDDVQVIRTPQHNLSMGDYFYAPAAYAQPVTQIGTDTMGFWVNVSNIGAADQTNLKVVASVTDENLVPIWSDSIQINTLVAGYIDTFLELPNTFIPNALTVGTYAVTYDITADSTDFDTSDNFGGNFFLVTDSSYNMVPSAASATRPGGNPNYQIGNVYRTSGGFNAGDFLATNFIFTAAVNAADGPLDGKIVNVWLVEVAANVDAEYDNFDTNLDLDNNPDLTRVGFHTYTFPTGAANYDDFIGQLEDINTGNAGVPLKPNTRYFLLTEYTGANNVIFSGVSEARDYFQISTIIYNESDGTWYLGGFGEETSAFVGMDIRDIRPTSNTRTVELENATLDVYPNPATAFVNLDVTFEESTEAFMFITDATGKLVRTQDLGNIVNERVRVDVSNLAAGTYFAKISTNEGVLVKRFVVAK